MGTGVWSPEGATERCASWVSLVWEQLNACLSRLGTHEALLGPQLFLSCPVAPDNTQAVVRCVCETANCTFHFPSSCPVTFRVTFSLTFSVARQVAGSALERRGRPPRGSSRHLAGNGQALPRLLLFVASNVS